MNSKFPHAQDVFTEKMILIAEDNEFLRQAYGEVFTYLGCEVLTAANGEEALAQFQQYEGDIHLIILDLDIPLIKGEEVYRRVQARAPEMKVIISSARDEEEARNRLDDNKSLPFIRKPFSISSLVHRARSLLLDAPVSSTQGLDK